MDGRLFAAINRGAAALEGPSESGARGDVCRLNFVGVLRAGEGLGSVRCVGGAMPSRMGFRRISRGRLGLAAYGGLIILVPIGRNSAHFGVYGGRARGGSTRYANSAQASRRAPGTRAHSTARARRSPGFHKTTSVIVPRRVFATIRVSIPYSRARRNCYARERAMVVARLERASPRPSYGSQSTSAHGLMARRGILRRILGPSQEL